MLSTTTLIAIVVLVLSILVTSSQKAQIESLESIKVSLNEQAAYLRGTLSSLSHIKPALAADELLPHPIPVDRDMLVIGTHADVAWSNPSTHTLAAPQYELNVLQLSGEPGDLPNFFLASDSSHSTSRIPANPRRSLAPGSYIWRVAQVSPGYAITDNPQPDIGMLSPWSNYGSFTVYSDIEQRIIQTGHVRVGADLSQNSPFIYPEQRQLRGSDADKITELIQTCIVRSATTLLYDDRGCSGKRTEPLPPTLSSLQVQFVSIAKWGDWRPALRRKEIDLFIGGVTRAQSREGDGVSFLLPYYSFTTKLYVKKTDNPNGTTTLAKWLRFPRLVGVIESSSNEQLLDKIITSRCPPTRLGRSGSPCIVTKATFASFPALDRALDSGAIDGLLVDETFVGRTDDWRPLADIRNTEQKAWRSYVKDFLGYSSEQYSFAVAVDDPIPPGCRLETVLNLALQGAVRDKKHVNTPCFISASHQ